MQDRSSKKPERPLAPNQPAQQIVLEAPVKPKKQEPPQKNPAAVALGRLGGLKGGKARAAKLTPEKRSEIARKAARSRWAKERALAADSGDGGEE
jgi:hypothetical protein